MRAVSDTYVYFWDPFLHTGLPKFSLNMRRGAWFYCNLIYYVCLMSLEDCLFLKGNEREVDGMGLEERVWEEVEKKNYDFNVIYETKNKSALVPIIIWYSFKCKKNNVTTINGEKLQGSLSVSGYFFKSPTFHSTLWQLTRMLVRTIFRLEKVIQMIKDIPVCKWDELLILVKKTSNLWKLFITHIPCNY